MTHAFHTRRSSDLKRKSTANAAERREGSDPSADRSGVELRLLGVTLRPQVTPPLAKPATHLSGQRRTARCDRAGLARPAYIAQPRRPLCTHHRASARAALCEYNALAGLDVSQRRHMASPRFDIAHTFSGRPPPSARPSNSRFAGGAHG